MVLTKDNIELRLGGSRVGFSARRIWEHTQHGQLNPFKSLTPSRATDPGQFIEILAFVDRTPVLSGFVLSDLYTNDNVNIPGKIILILKQYIDTPAGKAWLRAVEEHLVEHAGQVYVRNRLRPFLNVGGNSPLGIAGLKCALQEWLDQNAETRASPAQWLARIKKLEQSGLRRDELARSLSQKKLKAIQKKVISGAEVKALLDYSRLRINIIPVREKSRDHLKFRLATWADPIKKIKLGFTSEKAVEAVWYDPVLGYWIGHVTWDDLLGSQEAWVAFTSRGQLVTRGKWQSGLCERPAQAIKLADEHARRLYPRLSAVGRWSEHSLTGGRDYREWLVTLPYFRSGYFSSHFGPRNILFHVRTDLREGPQGERVLFIQEIQSDWCQGARKTGDKRNFIPRPPWFREWPELALKLLLLHASKSGVAALAWTPGHVQVTRWEGLGERGLLELYDRRLPSALNRILKKYKKSCEAIDVFIPSNFSINPVEDGYEVRDKDGKLVGAAETWKQARVLIPSGGQEGLLTAHGVTLENEIRKGILEDGFFAWGYGIK